MSHTDQKGIERKEKKIKEQWGGRRLERKIGKYIIVGVPLTAAGQLLFSRLKNDSCKRLGAQQNSMGMSAVV